MLDLVISPSLTVNSDCPGKLKLSRTDADVWTLSDIEGRPPGVSFGGTCVGPPCPTAEVSKGLAALDTHPFENTVMMTVSPPAIGIVASGPKETHLVGRGVSVLVRVLNFLSRETLTLPPRLIVSFGCVTGPGPGWVLRGPGSS